MSHSFCPVNPVAIERAFVASYLHMTNNRSIRVVVKRVCSITEVGAGVWLFPVAIPAPPRRFVGVATLRPTGQFAAHQLVHFTERAFGYASTIVARPLNGTQFRREHGGTYNRIFFPLGVGNPGRCSVPADTTRTPGGRGCRLPYRLPSMAMCLTLSSDQDNHNRL